MFIVSLAFLAVFIFACAVAHLILSKFFICLSLYNFIVIKFCFYYVIGCCGILLIFHLFSVTRDDRQFLDAVKESPASVIVAIICFFSVWSILGLAGFHTYLTTSNQTTNEDVSTDMLKKKNNQSLFFLD